VKMFFACLVFVALAVSSVTPAQAQKKSGGTSAGAAASTGASTNTSSTPASSSSAAIESQMVTFGALNLIAKKVATETCSNIYPPGSTGDKTLVIFDQTTFGNLAAYQGFVANALALKSLYLSLVNPDEIVAVNKCTWSLAATRTRLTHCNEYFRRAVYQNQLSTLAVDKQYQCTADIDKKELAAEECDKWNASHPNANQPCPTANAIGLSSTIDPFSDATSLLSAIAVASNSESPGSIVIPDSAMAVAVTRELKNDTSNACHANVSHLTVIYPPLFGTSSTSDIAPSDMQSVIDELHDFRSCVIQQMDARNNNWLQQQKPAPAPAPAPGGGSALPANPNCKSSCASASVNSSPAGNTSPGAPATTSDPITTPALTDVNGMYDSFMNSLQQLNSSSGTVGSGAVEQGYQLATVLAGPRGASSASGQPTFPNPSYILLASILSAGGTMRDHKSLWTNLGNGDKITFSGGLMVNVALWQANGKLPLYTDILRYRVPFSNVANPTVDSTPAKAGDNIH
jgi:hypothetical protein